MAFYVIQHVNLHNVVSCVMLELFVISSPLIMKHELSSE